MLNNSQFKATECWFKATLTHDNTEQHDQKTLHSADNINDSSKWQLAHTSNQVGHDTSSAHEAVQAKATDYIRQQRVGDLLLKRVGEEDEPDAITTLEAIIAHQTK